MIVPLNPEQEVATEAIQGNVCVVAGPGTGKSTTLVNRYLRMISTHRIRSEDILNLTFTSEAAKNMIEKVGLFGAKEVFRTFHSFALDLIQKERANLPFQANEFILPKWGQDFQLLKDLIKRYPAITTFNLLKDRITEWKASNVSPEQAMRDMYYDKKGGFFYATAYRDYETECRMQGWLDFDSLMRETVRLLETNDAVRQRWIRKYICVDECQDTDVVQFRLLQLIYGGNIFVVGDENQCQPPGTLVDVLVRPKKGQKESFIKQVPIEKLSEKDDKLVSWDVRGKRIRFGIGRKFRREVRLFDGNVLKLFSGGKETKVTPNHFIWTKFNKKALQLKTHFVYLMWRKDLGFRVGTSALRTSCGSNQVSHRGYQERADKMWILDVVKSGEEARIREEIYSLQYQIPERVFQSGGNAIRVFQAVDGKGGFRLLLDKGLLFESPLISWNMRQKYLTKFHGYFRTAAANLLPRVMDLPTRQNYKSEPISDIWKTRYRGPVYSLEVEKDHTYVADGIPVGNCIYEWRSAVAGNLSNFTDHFPGSRTLYLGANYRSTGAIVGFLKKILPVNNGLASHMRSMREEGEKPKIVKYDNEDSECFRVMKQITDPNNTAIIARTNRQLRTAQKWAMSKGIKSMILGRKDLWQTTEVKHLIDLVKPLKSDPRPADKVLTEAMTQHNLTHVYRNTGGPNEKPPVENLNDFVKLAVGRGNISEFLKWVNRISYACEAAKAFGYEHKDKNPVLTLSTVHQAKGREFKNVFVIGCKQGKMPHTDGEITEEKRIFFVACSRAADRLHISYDGPRSQFLDPTLLADVAVFSDESDEYKDLGGEQLRRTAESTKHKASAAELALGLV